MTLTDVFRARLWNSQLLGARAKTAAEVVASLGAVQSQDYAGAKWAIAQRMATPTTNAMLDESFNAGEILRTHVLRPTWHFVAPEDLRWMLALTAPRVHQANAYMYRQLELDAAIFRRASAALVKALEDGAPMTREEISAVYKKHRIVASGPRLAALVMHAELEGLVCSGPLRGKQFTYALLEKRVAKVPRLDRDEALAGLTRRFFTSHGPAQTRDFAWWSGLTLTDARRGLDHAKEHLEEIDVEGATYWFRPSEKRLGFKAPVLHLLPNYDEFLGSYRDNRASLTPEVLNRIQDQPGRFVHTIVLNGRVVGGWRREIGKRSVALTVDLFVSLSGSERKALQRAIDAYGAFLDLPVAVSAR